jgi:peptide/nickel transport system substrate-binding protein
MFNHKGHKGTQRLVGFGPEDPTRKDTACEQAFQLPNYQFTQLPNLLRASVSPWWIFSLLLLAILSCSRPPDPNTLQMLIEFSPNSLDPRVGVDAQSERIDELMFDSLVRKDEHFNLQPWVAEKWETPDSQTYVFHIRRAIRFHDGRPLTAHDVKWTLDSMRNGTLRTPKGSTYQLVDKVETPDDFTLLVHLREPNATLLWNLSDGAFGIVPDRSGQDFNSHPIGSGPFKFVRFDIDDQVIIARNDDYWAEHARLQRVRFAVVPDATTRALELRKGSADIATNALPLDTVAALKKEKDLRFLQGPGTILLYLTFNLQDPILKDVRVRHAIAYAIDREAILHYLFRDAGRLADSVLPPEHWAYNGNIAHYPHDPVKANAILDSAGYARGKDGVRFHLTMKTSDDQTARLQATVLQQQLRSAGIAVDIRSFEFNTFMSDVVKGAFQMYSLRLIGGNQDPDVFEGFFHSRSFPPKRYNRERYSNPEVDRLIDEGRRTLDQDKRKQIYGEIQRILADDLPFINFLYLDNVIVYSKRVNHLETNPSGNYDFLRKCELAQ